MEKAILLEDNKLLLDIFSNISISVRNVEEEDELLPLYAMFVEDRK